MIRSAFGFGEALIAVPLLTLFMPLNVAAPLAVLLSIFVAAIVVFQDRRHIHLQRAAALLASTVFGIPVGLILLTHARQEIVKAVLGVMLLLFTAYSLLCRGSDNVKHESRSLLLLAGFLAGILGGAYGMNGPPLVVYGSSRKWSPQQFRATLHAYFLPASIFGMLGYWSAGLWTRTVTNDFFFSVPAMVPAVFLGRLVSQRLSGRGFLRWIYYGLMLIGILLIVETLSRHHA